MVDSTCMAGAALAAEVGSAVAAEQLGRQQIIVLGLMKCRYMDEQTGSRGVVFATGTPVSKSYNKWLAEQRPSLLIDIQAKLSEGKGAGYERWAKVFNLKQMAQTINFLKENGDMEFDELSHRAEAASEKCSALTEKLKATEARMSEVEELKKQVIIYLRTRETFRAYKASGYSKRYLAEHEQEILLHRAAKKAFNDLGLKKLPTVKALQAEYAALLAEKRAAYPAYREARAEMKKLLTYRANAEAMLNVDAKADGKQKEHEQR